MEMPDAKTRAEAHFDNYVGPMIELMQRQAYETARFHYVTSHIHGTVHGREDTLLAGKGLPGVQAEVSEEVSAEVANVP